MEGIDLRSPQAYENLLINPDFDIAQEHTSVATMADDTYIMDGYVYYKSGSMVHTGSQAADAPSVSLSGHKSTNCLLVDCTTADAAIAAGDYAYVTQLIEGYIAKNILENPFFLRFAHKHTKTGTYCVAFKNSGNDRTYVAEYTQDTTDTWEIANIAVPASPSAGTWNYTNGIGLKVIWTLASGSTYQTTAGSWATGNYLATSNQVNACDSASNNFKIGQAALYPGPYNLGFYSPSITNQLRQCFRYFEKSYDIATAPGSTGAAADKGELVRWSHDTFALYNSCIDFRITKRSNDPTVSIYSPETGASGKVAQHSSGDVYEADKSSLITVESETNCRFSGNGNLDAEKLIHFHYTADDRLRES